MDINYRGKPSLEHINSGKLVTVKLSNHKFSFEKVYCSTLSRTLVLVALLLLPFVQIKKTLAKPNPDEQSAISELIRQGLVKIRKGEPEQALLDARKAIEKDSNSAEAYFLLGRAEQDIGLKSEALKSYTKAIELNPKNTKAYSNRALVKGSIGDMNGAINDLNRAISIDPKYATAYLNRGVTHGAMGNKKAAIEDFDRAIMANPRYPDAYRNRGITKELIGKINEACSDWKKAASLGQKDAATWFKTQCSNTAINLTR